MFLITCFIFGLLGSFTWADVCPPGTIADKDGSQWYCYKFHEDRLTFTEAEKVCQFTWGGHLTSETNDKLTRRIVAYVTKKNQAGRFVWIGLWRPAGSDVITGWRWTDGTRSTYRNWALGEPHIEIYRDSCVHLFTEPGGKKWADVDCNHKFPFLCKWKLSWQV